MKDWVEDTKKGVHHRFCPGAEIEGVIPAGQTQKVVDSLFNDSYLSQSVKEILLTHLGYGLVFGLCLYCALCEILLCESTTLEEIRRNFCATIQNRKTHILVEPASFEVAHGSLWPLKDLRTSSLELFAPCENFASGQFKPIACSDGFLWPAIRFIQRGEVDSAHQVEVRNGQTLVSAGVDSE